VNYHLLLVGNSKQHWRKTLSEAAAALGDVDVCTEQQIEAQLNKRQYALVIIDATEVDEPEQLVHRINCRPQTCRTIIAAAAPTWQNAREAFRAGAHDYIRKYSDKEKLSVFLLQTLSERV
jgi:DNA-binding NtrC family response regulator